MKSLSSALKSGPASLHQSIDCSVHKKPARSARLSAVDTGVVDKPDTLPCADARACDVRAVRRVRDEAQIYRSAPRQFVRPGPAMLPPEVGRRNPLPDCLLAMNTADNVSDSLPDSRPRQRRGSQLPERD